MIPHPYLYLAAAGTLAASLAACYGFGYSHARHQAAIERAKIEAIAIATDARYRKLETEVADAQAAYVTSWTASRDAARADWLRLKTDNRNRVPEIHSKCGDTEPDGGGSVDGDGIPAHEGQWCVCR